MACTDQCTCNGQEAATGELSPLERAFYDVYIGHVFPAFRYTESATSAAREYAKKQVEFVHEYQRQAGVIEVSKDAWNDLLDELASTRREFKVCRDQVEAAEEAARTARRDHAKEVRALREEIDRLHDEIRVARTLIRAADKALS